MAIWSTCVIIFYYVTQSMGAVNLSPGVPLPNADFLYRIIMTKVFESGSSVDGSYIVDFLLGEAKARDPDIPQIKVLDYPTFRKIIKLAKIRHLNKTLGTMYKKNYEKYKHYKFNRTRRQYFRDTDKTNETNKVNKTRRYDISDDKRHAYDRTKVYRVTYDSEYNMYLRQPEAFKFAYRFMSLMQQSVYQTQYNVKKTKFYRKKYQSDLNYKFALLYGMILESKDKIDALLNIMTNLNHEYIYQREPQHFIYFLSIYEKILAASTDIDYLAKHLIALRHGIRNSAIKAQKKQKPT